MRLSEQLPEYDFAERHELAVDAPAERTLAAAREVALRDAPLIGLLFGLRGMRSGPGSLFEAMRAAAFELVAEEPGREVVLGAVGRPWQPRGGIRGGVDFRSFAERGYAKMAFNFVADGRTLATETRVLLTDAASRRRFRAYWLAIRPFSGLIRRLWLRAAKRRAEQDASRAA